MAAKFIVILILALTAFQGLNADTLLKRNLFENLFGKGINVTKGLVNEFGGSFEEIANKLSHPNDTTTKRSPSWLDTFEGIVSGFQQAANDVQAASQQAVQNITSAFGSMGKRSPAIYDNLQSQFEQLANVAHGQQVTNKRSPSWFEDFWNKAKEIQNKTKEFAEKAKERFEEDKKEILNKTKEFAEKAKEHFEEDKNKFEELIKNVTDNIFNRNGTSKRSILGDIFQKFQEAGNKTKEFAEKAKEQFEEDKEKIQNKVKEFAEKAKEHFEEDKNKFEELIKNVTDKIFNRNGTSKRSILGDIFQKFQEAGNKTKEFAEKAKEHFEEDKEKIQNKVKEFAEKAKEHFEEDKNKFEELIKNVTDKIFNRNGTSKRSTSIFGDILQKFQEARNKTQQFAEKLKEDFDEDVQDAKQTFETIIKNITQFFKGNNQNTTTASKRDTTNDVLSTFLQNLQSSIDAVVQKIKSAIATNANNTKFLDVLKNITSDFVNKKFNLKEITADISECIKAEKQNVTNNFNVTKAALEDALDKEEQAAEPFFKSVAVTAPKVANLIEQASLNISSCGQNYICIAVKAANALKQAQALEPEVKQEVQAGWALLQTFYADAKTINEQILKPAFAEMKAIGEETVACIENKIDA